MVNLDDSLYILGIFGRGVGLRCQTRQVNSSEMNLHVIPPQRIAAAARESIHAVTCNYESMMGANLSLKNKRLRVYHLSTTVLQRMSVFKHSKSSNPWGKNSV